MSGDEHRIIHQSGNHAGSEVICSCGWRKTTRFPASLPAAVGQQSAAVDFADHAKHMRLVHAEPYRYQFNGCGVWCDYPRAHMEDVKARYLAAAGS